MYDRQMAHRLVVTVLVADSSADAQAVDEISTDLHEALRFSCKYGGGSPDR